MARAGAMTPSPSPADAPDRGPCPRLYHVGRARCSGCDYRWPWPEGAPLPSESPLIPVKVACPKCHQIVPLKPEPFDEGWWKACAFP